jgi:serine/threonine-protein kinase
MPAKVILTVVTEGPLKGKQFVFDERASTIVGRDQDCTPRLPNDAGHKTISRHHCLLDVNPPDARVRDFGSLNGTLLNGVKIGQRDRGMSREEAAQKQFPEHDLKDGDTIELGKTAFRVNVHVPTMCATCQAEITDDQKAQALIAGNVYQCAACRERARPSAPPASPARVCAKCGRDVTAEAGTVRSGEFICAACKSAPYQVLLRLLELADADTEELQSLRGYEVVDELGRGSMGAVYRVRHRQSGEEVALKLLLPEVAADPSAKQRFQREVENTKVLVHPNVVRLRDAGCAHGTFFFTLDYCEGGSVDQLVKQHSGPIPVPEALTILRQVLDGLAYTHTAEVPYLKRTDGTIGPGRGIVHRDIKPQNIFLSGGVAKVGDYGLAKAFDAAGLGGLTRTGKAAGTPVFMPRQQVASFKYAKPEVDVWAAAAVFYFLVTGFFPRDFPRGKDKWQVVLQTDPVPIRQRNPAIAARLAEVIDLALTDRPRIHFKTARELKEAL